MAKKPDREASEIVRLRAELRGGRKPTARESRAERKRTLRLVREGKKKWAAVRGTPAAQKLPPHSRILSLQEFLESLEAPKPKPQRGQAGRKAALSVNRERGDKTMMRIHRLVLRGLKPQQVARRTGCSVSTIYRHWPK